MTSVFINSLPVPAKKMAKFINVPYFGWWWYFVFQANGNSFQAKSLLVSSDDRMLVSWGTGVDKCEQTPTSAKLVSTDHSAGLVQISGELQNNFALPHCLYLITCPVLQVQEMWLQQVLLVTGLSKTYKDAMHGVCLKESQLACSHSTPRHVSVLDRTF